MGMGVSRRMLLTIALGIALVGVLAALAARQTTTPPDRAPRAQATGTTVAPAMEELQIGAARAQTVRARVGQPLRLTIDGAGVPDTVEVVGLDQVTQIAPELPAVFDLLPSREGTFPIELQDSGERIGALRVTAAR
jgi:hypothetical protein